MRKPSPATVIALVALFGAVPAPASARAPVQTITVVNQAHVRPAKLLRVERAIVAQSAQLRHAWHTPLVRFGPGGWKLYLVRRFTVDPVYGTVEGGDPMFAGANLSGMHATNLRLAIPRPYLVAETTHHPGYRSWSVIVSHEILETLANPTAAHYRDGVLFEVCDGVSSTDYRLDGVWVSDFTWPSDWRTVRDWGAQWDQAGVA